MILVTGATGFVGRSLSAELLTQGSDVSVAIRQENASIPLGIKINNVGDFTAETDWLDALLGVEVVVHTAARVHVMNDTSHDPLEEFRKVNTYATLNLAKQAADSGVKRFVFLSSIGVNGNNNFKPFTEQQELEPHDLYAISKLEAEKGLLALAQHTSMEVVIIRPPLVYGANAPGNFGNLVKWISKSIPLPFGAIRNQRSLVALDNLVDFIILCADREKSPKAVNQVFLISDNEDVSTTQLLRKVAKSLNKQAWLIPVPVGLMTFAAKLIGKGDVANRLFGSLQVDSAKARDLLGWKPVVTMDEQLKKTTDAYLAKLKA
jgi:nucleoside-diphosphate-sugar epimerase